MGPVKGQGINGYHFWTGTKINGNCNIWTRQKHFGNCRRMRHKPLNVEISREIAGLCIIVKFLNPLHEPQKAFNGHLTTSSLVLTVQVF